MNPLGGRESLFARLKTKKMIAEIYLVRHFLSTQQSLVVGDLEKALWLPGSENSADSLTEVRSDVVPLL